MSTSEEESVADSGHIVDQELVSKSSCEQEEANKESMVEEAPLDTESEGSATTDSTLGNAMPSSQKVMLLEGPLGLGHPAGSDGRAEQVSTRCGGPTTTMVGGDATHMMHKKQREDPESKPPTALSSFTNSPKWEDEPPVEVPEDAALEFDQGNKDEVACYAMEAELKSLD